MFCQMCGAQVQQGVRYCGACGAQLAGGAAAWSVRRRSAEYSVHAPRPSQGRLQTYASQRPYAPQSNTAQQPYVPQLVATQPQPVRSAPRIRVNLLRVVLMSVIGVVLSVLIGTIICVGAAYASGAGKVAEPVVQAQVSPVAIDTDCLGT